MSLDDTGPPYPAAPVRGSNAIGEFQIGVSPIGSIPALQPETTIVSQYANSPTLTAVISLFFAAADLTADFDALYDFAWNVQSAQGFGLDSLGRIVGVGRVLQVAAGTFLGMEGPGGASGDPIGVSPFYAGGGVTTNFPLIDAAYRVLILAKAAANISNGSVASINKILLALFPGRGNCYATDGQDMTMTYTFEFQLSAVEQAIVGQTGVLPKPIGVQSSVVQQL